jgi:glutamate carboxypeptidase
LATDTSAREGYRVEIGGRFNRPPKEISAFEEKFFAEWQACGRELGVEPAWQKVDGSSDGNLLAAAGLPVLDELGSHDGRTHSAAEYVSLQSLEERAKVAARFLGRYARGETSV